VRHPMGSGGLLWSSQSDRSEDALAMPWHLLKLANRARKLPELDILLRGAVGVTGLFLLFRMIMNLVNRSDLGVIDYAGLILFTAVGAWLIRTALRGWR